MIKTLKTIFAIGLIVFVFFGSVPEFVPNIVPNEVDEVSSILNIEKPSEEILNKVRPIADLVTENEDRAKIALFNYEFCERILKYKTDSQQINDLYVKAASKFFGDSLRGKYPKLSTELTSLFQSVLADENHIVTDYEKKTLKQLFSGLSWCLIERKWNGPN